MGFPVPRSFSVKNFGCRATQADGAGIAADLAARGLQPVREHRRADVVVVNTCTVTSAADRDARKSINRIHRENPDAEILVTGCYAQRAPQDLAALGGVRWVVGNSHKHAIGSVLAPQLVQIQGAETVSLSYHGGIEAGVSLVGDISRQTALHPLPTGEPLGRSRPNVKVQDGCDNRCSFCIIPSVRGRSRSAAASSVVREVRGLQDDYAEVVLTGINLGRWGRDLNGRPRLPDLVQALLDRTSVRMVRLSSVEPMDWSERLVGLMASSSRIARHVHMPLQSASDSVLRRMRRRYRIRHYESRIRLAREAMPLAGIGADVMVGFPGESDEEFEQTRAFVERMPFTYLHVFSYSSRDGTDAAGHSDHVTKAVKRRRSRILRELIEWKNGSFRQGLAGTTLPATVLEGRRGRSRALTDNFVDVEVSGAPVSPGSLVRVRIDGIEGRRTFASRVS